MNVTRTCKGCGRPLVKKPGRWPSYCSECRPKRPYLGPSFTPFEGGNCGACLAPLPPRKPQAKARKWCNPSCAAWARRYPGQVRVAPLCELCDKPMRRTGARRHGDCDTQARTIGAVPHECLICKRPFMAWTERRYCSLRCRNKARAARIKADPEKHAHHRERCRKYESKSLNRRARHADRLQRYRAREAGLGAVKVDRLAILERDGWRCQVQECLFRSRKINPKLRAPHPGSATLDHIVPHSLGGMYAPVNLQAAHLRCNMAKGVGGTDQLRLIG